LVEKSKHCEDLMHWTYQPAMEQGVFPHEGGYTNDPRDPGGPTNWGITIFDARKYWKPNATAADVKAMKDEEAKAIYRAKYWDALACDELPAGVDYAVFDYGVNSGVGRSGKVLRRCLNLPDDTSAVRDSVIAAASHANAARLIAAICDERLRFLQSLKTWPVFGKGWGRRVAEVKAFSLQLAAGVPTRSPVSAMQARQVGKGEVPVSRAAQQGSAGAVIAAGAVTAQQAHQIGAPAATIAGIALVAIGIAVGVWLFWRRRQRRRQDMPA
jgi:lysozyme family protein